METEKFRDCLCWAREFRHMSKIYIINDDPYLDITLKGFLKEEGYEILDTAMNPNIVIINRTLTSDKLDAIPTFKLLDSNVKIMYLTDDSSDQAKARARNSGVDMFIVKPFLLDDFVDAVVKLSNK